MAIAMVFSSIRPRTCHNANTSVQKRSVLEQRISCTSRRQSCSLVLLPRLAETCKAAFSKPGCQTRCRPEPSCAAEITTTVSANKVESRHALQQIACSHTWQTGSGTHHAAQAWVHFAERPGGLAGYSCHYRPPKALIEMPCPAQAAIPMTDLLGRKLRRCTDQRQRCPTAAAVRKALRFEP